MKLNIYVVQDQKAQVYNAPFYQVNDAVAIRSCSAMRSDPSTPAYHHPEDFVLYLVGSYDDSNGEIVIESPMKVIGRFSDFPESSNNG